ncbi:MAG TPA: magnesium chelatase domain-containing protein, partial [Candidatus Saccharimonadales bacterium]|nr:magnesium chelatase domain-containing protein [Candidatus Saccharimonadales bacterium]
MGARVQSVVDYGTSGLVVMIECHVSNNLPNIVIVGFGNRAVDESKERIRGAFSSSKLQLPRKRITINLAPADIPKDSSSFDLAIAASILQTSAVLERQLTDKDAIMGELGLDGSVRPVRGIIGKILAGRQRGISTFYIPAGNLPQAQLIPGVTLVPVEKLQDLYQHLAHGFEITKIETGAGIHTKPAVPSAALSTEAFGLSDIIGQHLAKRALEIAAAGGHNILLNGPPGTGKSMLARALPSL